MDELGELPQRDLVPVDDPTRVSGVTPPLAFVLEPRFEEYSFLTPKDIAKRARAIENQLFAAGAAPIVTFTSSAMYPCAETETLTSPGGSASETGPPERTA